MTSLKKHRSRKRAHQKSKRKLNSRSPGKNVFSNKHPKGDYIEQIPTSLLGDSVENKFRKLFPETSNEKYRRGWDRIFGNK